MCFCGQALRCAEAVADSSAKDLYESLSAFAAASPAFVQALRSGQEIFVEDMRTVRRVTCLAPTVLAALLAPP